MSNTATHAMLRSFGPVLRPGGRFLVVASSLGTLGHLDPALHDLFDGASLDQVEYAVESWRGAVHNRTTAEAGWPRWLNVPSKVAQVAAVRAVAAERREHDLATDTLIASVCPGMVDTDTSRPWFSDFSQAQSLGRGSGRRTRPRPRRARRPHPLRRVGPLRQGPGLVRGHTAGGTGPADHTVTASVSVYR